MEGPIRGSRRGNHFLTEPPPTVKHGGGNNLMVWGCMGWNGVGVLTEVQGIMSGEQYCEILDGGVVESFEKLEMPEGRGHSSRTMTQNTHPRRQPSGLKTTTLMSWPGQLNPLISTPLNTSG